MTSFVLGFFWELPDMVEECMWEDGSDNAAACKAVDNRDTKMDPTFPGKAIYIKQRHFSRKSYDISDG